jgi:hypothetical protein
MKKTIIPIIMIVMFLISCISAFAAAPIISNVNIISSLNTFTSDENISMSADIADADGDDYKNLSIFYQNNQSRMLSYYPFDTNASTEFVNQENNGTNNGATWNQTGGYDGFGAYKFDGDNDYININTITFNDSYSISFLAKLNEINSNMAIFGNGTITGGDYIYFATNERLSIRDNSGDYATSNVITDYDKWKHFFISCSKNTCSFFIDGVNDTNEGSLTSFFDISEIGKSGDWNFNGSIDEIRIYNYALSAEQIKAIYQNKTDTIVSQETSNDDIWSVCAYAVDINADLSNKTCSGNYLIGSQNITAEITNPIYKASNNFTLDISVNSADRNISNISCEISKDGIIQITSTNTTEITAPHNYSFNIYNNNLSGNGKYHISCILTDDIDYENYITETITKDFIYDNTDYTLKRFQCDMSSTPKALTILGFTLIMIILWIFALWSKIPIINIIIGLVMCYFSWYLVTCFLFAQIIFIVLGLTSICYGAIYATSKR